jgi:hypothetical protein
VSDRLKSWREMQPLVKAIYARHGAGCCWHVVLDDGNVGDDSVRFCIQEAQRNNCDCCKLLIPLMLRASRTQRLKARP